MSETERAALPILLVGILGAVTACVAFATGTAWGSPVVVHEFLLWLAWRI